MDPSSKQSSIEEFHSDIRTGDASYRKSKKHWHSFSATALGSPSRSYSPLSSLASSDSAGFRLHVSCFNSAQTSRGVCSGFGSSFAPYTIAHIYI
jgi:hypothetical protein